MYRGGGGGALVVHILTPYSTFSMFPCFVRELQKVARALLTEQL